MSLLPQNGFGDFFSGSNAFSGQIPQLPQTRPPINTPKPQIPVTTLDPDDTIYNDVNKPVNEDYDPVVPDKYSTNKRPGQYLTVSNPIFGQYTAYFNAQSFFNGVGNLIDELVHAL